MSQAENIVLVVIGGGRADRVSSYGHARATTPFLDEVAAAGVRATHAFASAATAVPATAALLTGCYSAQHGAHEESRQLSRATSSLAQELRGRGYRTAAFCSNTAISPETGFGGGFDSFVTQRRSNGLADRAWAYGRRASDRLLRRRDAGARRTNESFREWLASASEPFFAFLDYDEARLPFDPLPPTDLRFVSAAELSQLREVDQSGYRYVTGAASLAPAAVDLVDRAYDSALHYVDARAAEVAEALERRGVWGRTCLVLVGDCGQLLGEGGTLGSPLGLRDPLLHVPLVLRCPDVLPQGFVVDELCQTVDVAPTLMSLVQDDASLQCFGGRPLLQRGRPTAGPGWVVAERHRDDAGRWRKQFPNFNPERIDVRTKSIRTRTRKLVWRSDGAHEFYDLGVDPREERNSIATNGDAADDLRRQLFDWFSRASQASGPSVATAAALGV